MIIQEGRVSEVQRRIVHHQGHGNFSRIGAKNQVVREIEKKDFFSRRTTTIFTSFHKVLYHCQSVGD